MNSNYKFILLLFSVGKISLKQTFLEICLICACEHCSIYGCSFEIYFSFFKLLPVGSCFFWFIVNINVVISFILICVFLLLRVAGVGGNLYVWFGDESILNSDVPPVWVVCVLNSSVIGNSMLETTRLIANITDRCWSTDFQGCFPGFRPCVKAEAVCIPRSLASAYPHESISTSHCN